VSFLRPFFLRLEMTPRPLAEDIRSLKPCLFFLFLLEGWNVLFMIHLFEGAKVAKILNKQSICLKKIPRQNARKQGCFPHAPGRAKVRRSNPLPSVQ
jgi:hypothetical protein